MKISSDALSYLSSRPGFRLFLAGNDSADASLITVEKEIGFGCLILTLCEFYGQTQQCKAEHSIYLDTSELPLLLSASEDELTERFGAMEAYRPLLTKLGAEDFRCEFALTTGGDLTETENPPEVYVSSSKRDATKVLRAATAAGFEAELDASGPRFVISLRSVGMLALPEAAE